MFKKILLLNILLISACTTQPKEEAIPQYNMPFVLPIVIKDSNIFMGATNNDERYKSGKLAAANIKKMLSADINPKNYISKEYEIYSDTQIIKIFESQIFLISKSKNNLLVLPLNSDNINCQTNTNTLYDCQNSLTHNIKNDPKSLQIFKDSTNNIYAFIAYSSEHIDILKIENNKISLIKTISVALMISKTSYNYEIIQIQTTKDDILILFKSYVKHNKKHESLAEHNLDTLKEHQVYLAKATIKDIINNDYNNLEVKSLSDLGIIDAKDLYMQNNEALILSHNPSSLFKVNLVDYSITKRVEVCPSATMLATNLAKNALVIPCFSDNIVQLFSLNDLQIKNQANIKKQTPSYAAIDQVNNLIFVSYFEEHIVGVFDMNLKLIKTLFKKAQ